MKKILHIQKNNTSHWVGDGFPVRSIFSYNDIGKDISPFLLMDYAGPMEFSSTTQRRGVGEHPHRGFETVTIVYSGEVEHRDSSGGGGIIRPGDVQWMTAASGIVHEEFHGKNFAKDGGTFEMVQLWVNLPKKDKMTAPRYQGIRKERIPQASLPNNAGSVRIITGKFLDHAGPALTFTPINLWDIRLHSSVPVQFQVPKGHTAALFVLSGEVVINTEQTIKDAELALLEREDDLFTLQATNPAKILFLGGEPINEPIVGYGPFVMNNKAEVQQAFLDYQSGKMGSLEKIEGTE